MKRSAKKHLFSILVCMLICFLVAGFFAVMLIEFIAMSDAGITYAEYERKYLKAKVNCYLFKTSDITSSLHTNVFFIIPDSYFVTLLSEVNSSVFKVEYKGVIGYVSSDSVQLASFTPICKTLDGIYFDIDSNVSTQLRRSPTAEVETNVTTIIPAGTTRVSYIAQAKGVKPNGGNSDIWYYCQYQPINDPTSVYTGYVYSEKTTNLSAIPVNEENNPESKPPSADIPSDEQIKMSVPVKTTLIILISLPIVLVFILLVINNHKSIKKTKKIEEGSVEVEPQKQKSNKQRSVSSLKDKKLTRKQDDYVFVARGDQLNNSVSAVFPTYEQEDDDDLL